MITKYLQLILDTKSADKNADKTDKKLQKLDKTTKDIGNSGSKSIGGLSSAMSALPAPIQRVIGGLQSLKVALISTGIGALVVAAGSLAGLFISATKKGAEFAKQLSTLKAVSGASKEEMELLSRSAKELGSTTQFTAVEVAQLQTEYAKLGKTTPEILAATEATLDLAASLEVGLAEAATLAGSVVNSFGLQAKDTQRVVDVLAKSTSSSSLDFGLLTESLKMAAPIARATGKTIEETAGLLGVLADNGVKGSIAGTGLSKVMSQLNKKGLTFEQAYQKVNNSTDKLGTAQELVGEIGAKSLLNLANSEKAINKLTGALEASEGAAKRMAEIRLDNLEGDTTKLGSAWEGFLLSVEDGEGIFTRIARSFVQGLTNIVSSLTFVSKATGAFFKEIRETAGVSIAVLKTGIKNALRGIQSSFLSFKETIADIPFIGKAIDKEKLAKDREALNQALAKADQDAKYWADISKKRAEEGNIFERTLNRLKQKEQEKIDRELSESNKVKSDANIEGLEEEEEATRDLIKLKEAELKAIQDTEAKTRDEVAVRNEKVKAIQAEIRELQNLRTVKFDIEKMDFEEMPKLQAREAQKVEIRTGAEDLIARHIKKVSDETTADDIIRTEEEFERNRALNNSKVDSTLNALSSIGQIADAFAQGDRERAKKAFKINKAIGIAQATINTARGIVNELSHPVKSLTFTNYAAAAAMALAGAAQIATISATRFDSGGGNTPTTTGDAGGGGASQNLNSPSIAPSFNVVGQSQANQVSMALANQPPTQAFVVAGDVTTAQELQNNTISQATF